MRRGSALLDVMIALAVLGLSGVALITLLGQTSHSIRHVRDTEREVRAASDELGRFMIFNRAELGALVGKRSAHGWAVDVERPDPDLFDITIARDDSTGAVLLRTTIYRPDTTHADH